MFEKIKQLPLELRVIIFVVITSLCVMVISISGIHYTRTHCLEKWASIECSGLTGTR
jgi:hypothetical protein